MDEQKIKEAYAKAVQKDLYVTNYLSFKTGYLALLNELEFVGENKVEKLYALPEGVKK
jgi:hypothetical protein